MTRQQPAPGLEAKHAVECPRCDDLINVGDRYVFSRGRLIHCQCASGSDE